MATLAEATAAPQEFEYKGTTLLLHPLRLQDLGYVDRWLRSEFQRTAYETLDSMEMSELERRERERAILEASQRITLWHPDTRIGIVQSQNALVRILWLSLRQGEAMELADVEARFGNDMDALLAAFDVIFHITWPDQAARADAEQRRAAKGERAAPEGKKAQNPTSPTGKASTNNSPS